MASTSHAALSRRERQIMDILYRRGKATAGEVLEEKGHVRHEVDGIRYVYSPAVPRHTARRSALRHLVDTFFDGSTEKVVAALLGSDGGRLSEEELDRISALVERTRKEGGR